MTKYFGNESIRSAFFKQMFIFVPLLVCLLFSSSCVTKALWESKSYQEKISQFYVGSDSRYIVLIGPNYHYVLTDVGGNLRSILSLKQRGVLTISDKDSYINLDSNNSIKGYITFTGPFSVLPREDIYKLNSRGIFPNKDDDVEIKIKVRGRRYVAKYLSSTISSNNSLILRVHYSDSNLVKGVGKAAITPIAVTLDAVLLIGKVAFAPFKSN